MPTAPRPTLVPLAVGSVGWLRSRSAVAIAVVALGLGEWVAHGYFSGRAPRAEQWEALRPAVERRVLPGELLLIAPYWAEPLARAAFGDELMPLGHVARADETAFSTALQVSILGASEAPAGWQPQAAEVLGKFVLQRWVNPRVATPRFDFLTELSRESAVVTAVRRERRVPCRFQRKKVTNGDLHGHPTFPARRFQCPGGEWHFVGVTVVEDERYRPRRCIWAHPAGGESLRIRFEHVPMGQRLHGHGGLPYFVEREARGTPVQLEVLVDEQVVGRFEHEDGQGWAPFEFATEAWAGREASVEFRVSSRRAAFRNFCFHADVR